MVDNLKTGQHAEIHFSFLTGLTIWNAGIFLYVFGLV